MVLLKPLLFVVPDTTANQIRIMLLKGTHAPFLGLIWLFEHWEVLALRREEEERAAMGLDLEVDNGTSTTASTSPQSLKSKTNTSSSLKTSSKKHSLTKTGKVKIPAALLASASKRPSKKAGARQDTNGRVNTTPATLTGTNGAAPPPPPPGPAPEPTNVPAEAGTGQASQSLAAGAADVAEMMRMLKELSVQVEEVRSALVKHDAGPSVE